MDRHGIRRLQFREHVEAVLGAPVVKVDAHQLSFKVNPGNGTDIAVENAGSGAEPIASFPHYIIIVPDLHHPVALAEGKFSVLFLALSGLRRIENRLQRQIERPRSGLALPGRRKDLNVARRDAHVLRKTHRTQLLHRLHQHLRASAAHEKEVLVLARKIRQLAAVDRVGIHHDQALLRLPENFCKAHRRNFSAANEIGKNVSRADRGQLVRVSDQNQAAAGL